MGADYPFYVKSIATYAPAFFGYNNPVLARVCTIGMQSMNIILTLKFSIFVAVTPKSNKMVKNASLEMLGLSLRSLFLGMDMKMGIRRQLILR